MVYETLSTVIYDPYSAWIPMSVTSSVSIYSESLNYWGLAVCAGMLSFLFLSQRHVFAAEVIPLLYVIVSILCLWKVIMKRLYGSLCEYKPLEQLNTVMCLLTGAAAAGLIMFWWSQTLSETVPLACVHPQPGERVHGGHVTSSEMFTPINDGWRPSCSLDGCRLEEPESLSVLS